jgi:hypothetical protein
VLKASYLQEALVGIVDLVGVPPGHGRLVQVENRSKVDHKFSSQ